LENNLRMNRSVASLVLALCLVPVVTSAQLPPMARRPVPPRFGGSTTEPAPPAIQFPELSAQNLAGEDLAFPKVLEGRTSLIFLLSSPDQEIFLETWMPVVHRLQERHGDIALYVLAFLPPAGAKAPKKSAWPYVETARPILTAEERQKSLVPLYLDRKTVLDKLKIREDGGFQAILISPDNEMLWNDKGVRTNGKANALAMQTSRSVSGNRGE
jgi:hypothetical protein